MPVRILTSLLSLYIFFACFSFSWVSGARIPSRHDYLHPKRGINPRLSAPEASPRWLNRGRHRNFFHRPIEPVRRYSGLPLTSASIVSSIRGPTSKSPLIPSLASSKRPSVTTFPGGVFIQSSQPSIPSSTLYRSTSVPTTTIRSSSTIRGTSTSLNPWISSQSRPEPSSSTATSLSKFPSASSLSLVSSSLLRGSSSPGTLSSSRSISLASTSAPISVPSSSHTFPSSSRSVLVTSTSTGVAPSSSYSSTSKSLTSKSSTSFSSSLLVPSITASVISTTSIPIASATAPANGSFNAQSRSNIAVYFGQTPFTSTSSLLAQCQDPSVDIVILAFLTTFNGPGGYPTVNFGPLCGGQTDEMAAKAPGLLYCPDLAKQITQCQGLGKKVFLSLGGYIADSTFTSDQNAIRFAKQVWDLFGEGTGESAGLRPFGSVSVDGFDVDNENHNPNYYTSFATSLRSFYSSGTSGKRFYLSAAPQCPRPDASDPLPLLLLCDFVWVQFYNNGDCNLGASGFSSALVAWSSDLSAGNHPRLYIGAPASSSGGTGYQSASAMQNIIRQVLQQVQQGALSNFGGVMLWDGTEGSRNTVAGQNYQGSVKAALTGH